MKLAIFFWAHVYPPATMLGVQATCADTGSVVFMVCPQEAAPGYGEVEPGMPVIIQGIHVEEHGTKV